MMQVYQKINHNITPQKSAPPISLPVYGESIFTSPSSPRAALGGGESGGDSKPVTSSLLLPVANACLTALLLVPSVFVDPEPQAVLPNPRFLPTSPGSVSLASLNLISASDPESDDGLTGSGVAGVATPVEYGGTLSELDDGDAGRT
jgi:hypothetical protein